MILPTGLFGREEEGTENLLTLSGGDFFFRQMLTGAGIAAQSSGKLTCTAPREFTWSSYAEGQVELTNVTEVQPFDVIMLPSGQGSMTETAEWPIVDSGVLKRIHAVRYFSFDPTARLSGHQLREVRIDLSANELSLRLGIRSVIRRFSPLDAPR